MYHRSRMRRVNVSIFSFSLSRNSRAVLCLLRNTTLDKIKQNTFSCIKRQTPFSDLVYDQKNYYLESMTPGAQIIPLYDEQIKLNELK